MNKETNSTHKDSRHDQNSTRRQFMKNSASVAVASGFASAGAVAFPRSVHAAGDHVLRVGLIGCGGRGTGAARQALQADDHVKLVAMGDVFQDRLQLSLRSLAKIEEVAGKIDVPPEQQFVGFDSYEKVLATDVDVVLLTAPPHFRPIHLKAAIDAGKHVFAEKPVAVDAPGVRAVLETCAEAKRKGLSVVSGLRQPAQSGGGGDAVLGECVDAHHGERQHRADQADPRQHVGRRPAGEPMVDDRQRDRQRRQQRTASSSKGGRIRRAASRPTGESGTWFSPASRVCVSSGKIMCATCRSLIDARIALPIKAA